MLSMQSKATGGGFIEYDSGNILEVSETGEIFRLEGGLQIPISGIVVIEKSLVGKTSETFDIPAWAKEITVGYNRIQTSSTGIPTLALGDEDGIDNTTTYQGSSSLVGNTVTTTTIASSTGFPIRTSASATACIYSGVGRLVQENSAGVAWDFDMNVSRSDAGWIHLTSGRKSLGKRLTTLRMITSSGSDTFIGNSSMSVTIKG